MFWSPWLFCWNNATVLCCKDWIHLCFFFPSMSASLIPSKSESPVNTRAFNDFAVCKTNASARLKFGLRFLIEECNRPVFFAKFLSPTITLDREVIESNAIPASLPALFILDTTSAMVTTLVNALPLSILGFAFLPSSLPSRYSIHAQESMTYLLIKLVLPSHRTNSFKRSKPALPYLAYLHPHDFTFVYIFVLDYLLGYSDYK